MRDGCRRLGAIKSVLNCRTMGPGNGERLYVEGGRTFFTKKYLRDCSNDAGDQE